MLKTVPELIALAKENTHIQTAAQALPECLATKGVLIDVREVDEFKQKSIIEAVNIPRGILEMQMLKQFPDENTPIYIHCATGGRAALAAEQLQRIGYKKVTAISCHFKDIYQESQLNQ